MANITQSVDGPDDQLYLLEVIVDRVSVIQEGILKTFQDDAEENEDAIKNVSESPSGNIRVLVKFFDFPTIEIQEKDFIQKEFDEEGQGEDELQTKGVGFEDETAVATKEPSRISTEKQAPTPTASQIKEDILYRRKLNEEMRWKAEGRNVNAQMSTFEETENPPNKFSGGKSCLFPMVPQEMIDVVKTYFVEVQVHRDATKSEPGHLIGTARLLLGEEFIDAINVANSPAAVLPVTAFTENVHELYSVFGDLTGHVSLTMKLWCFGSTIFTQFKYIQGERGFKFSTSEGVMIPKPDVRQQVVREELKEEIQHSNKRQPFFTREDDVGMLVGPSLSDEFKVPVPWRKLCDKPVQPISCGPKRLFKEKKPQTATCCFDLAQISPSTNTLGVKNQNSYMASQPPSSGTIFQGAKCQGQMLTATALGLGDCYGAYEGSSLLPGQRGSGRGALDIPPGTKFPCQFGANWVTEANPCECANKPRNKRIGKDPCTNSHSCVNISENLSFEQGQVPSKKPVVDYSSLCASLSQPKHDSSSARCEMSKTGSHPIVEQAPPYLRSSAAGGANSPHENSKSPDRLVLCGLEQLFDPNQRNLDRLLQQPLLSPLCPADTVNKSRPALCSCPKVPILEPQSMARGILKCECNSIMTAMKPIDLPYMCQPHKDDQLQPAVTLSVPSLPTKQQPPVQDNHPLAKISNEATGHETLSAPEDKSELSHTNVSSGKAETENEGMENYLTSEKQKTAELPKSTKKTLTTSEESKSRKRANREKAKTILQEETAQNTTMSSYISDISSNTGDGKTSKISAAPSVADSKSLQSRRTKRKQKKSALRELLTKPSLQATIYPGCVIGHKDCVPILRWVPKRMGWLWNIKDADGYMKPGRGWRPGSIPTHVLKIMENVKTSEQSKAKTRVRMTKKVDTAKRQAAGGGDADMYYPVDDTPTVHMHKKHGKLYLSLCPRKRNNRQMNEVTGTDSMDGEGDVESDRPAQFRIDMKNPDGLDSDMYEPDSTSSNSEDSYEIDIVSPATLRNRQPQAIMHHVEIQVTENSFLHHSLDGKQVDVQTNKTSGSRSGKKRSTKDSRGKRKSGTRKSRTIRAK